MYILQYLVLLNIEYKDLNPSPAECEYALPLQTV